MFLKSILLAIPVVFLTGFSLNADTVYLKNGRTIEGFILEENPGSIQLDVGFGKVGLKRSEIESFSRSNEKDSGMLRDKWVRQKAASLERAKEEKLRELSAPKPKPAPKYVTIVDEHGQIVVEALLNRKIKALLILDTGATLTVIKESVAKQLGLDAAALKEDLKLRLVDGRDSIAKHAVLSSVNVHGVEAENVDVAILAADVQDPALKDGLLGMTYLKNFNFKIDQKNKKLILEKF